MSTPQMYNLTTLIKRLEAATSRLEDLAAIPSGLSSTVATPIPNGSTTSVQASSSVVSPVAPTGAPAPPSVVAPPETASLQDFDALINTEVQKYVELSNDLGGLVAEQSKIVERCFAEQRKFLLITTKAKKPSASSNLFMELICGMQKEVTAVGEIREQLNPRSQFYDHLSTVSEGILALVWVVDSKPADHVKGMHEASAYFGNRVMTEYKNKEKKHVEWVQSFFAVLKALQAYVKKHHLAGVAWNEKEGIDAKDALAALSAVPGSSITSRLKKVDKSEMTHKNPTLRVSSAVPEKSVRGKSPAPPPGRKPAHMKSKKHPKKELDGNKWIVENFENDHNVILPEVEISHSILICHCKNVVIKISGKCNAITMSECIKTHLACESLVSGVDIIKSNSFAIQVTNKVPTVQVDGCDGGILYIGKEGLDVEIFTSKTTGFNVMIAEAGEYGDWAERPVPEQLRHSIKNGQLVSEIVEHAG
ncbi:adenylate cyclase associated N terminal-domain-containing protein [Kalaharituber pfeilii]|nr:adenylate cyclase associated N terminal-domain-containing protein [Kalaharituber pfeilii]